MKKSGASDEVSRYLNSGEQSLRRTSEALGDAQRSSLAQLAKVNGREPAAVKGGDGQLAW